MVSKTSRCGIVVLCLLLCASGALALEDVFDRSFTKSGVLFWEPKEQPMENIDIDATIKGTGWVRITLIHGGEEVELFSRQGGVNDIVADDYVELAEGSEIGLIVSYGDGHWDSDDDGVDEEGIDFSLEPVFFSSYKEKHLCTVWDVLDVETEAYRTTCYGDGSCCEYVGYTSDLDDWDEDFVLLPQQAGDKNVVLTRLIFYNGSRVSYSNYDALEASFVNAEVGDIRYNRDYAAYNSSRYMLRVELDDDTFLFLRKITYEGVEQHAPVEEVIEEEVEEVDEVPAEKAPEYVAPGETVQETAESIAPEEEAEEVEAIAPVLPPQKEKPGFPQIHIRRNPLWFFFGGIAIALFVFMIYGIDQQFYKDVEHEVEEVIEHWKHR